MTEDAGLLLMTEPLVYVDSHIKEDIDEHVYISFNEKHLDVHVCTCYISVFLFRLR